jgi:hypothetical protein
VLRRASRRPLRAIDAILTARWDIEKAGEWSAYAPLFGPLRSGGVGRWADWIVDVLRSVPEFQDRRRFLDAMQERCRSIEEENDVGGQLLRGVEMLRFRMG